MTTERIGNVTLTRVIGSSYYYARYRKSGRQHVRSLRTEDIDEARTRAKVFAEGLTSRISRTAPDHSFRRYALETIESDARKVHRGERAASLVDDGRMVLRAYLQKPFGDDDVRDITHVMLKKFVDDLTGRELASATIKRALSFVSKTLKTAANTGVLKTLPLMPEVSLKQSVRGWFSPTEYEQLLKACRTHAEAGTKTRYSVITEELRLYASFMVNTFLRPSDSKLLRNRHIQIVRTKETRYLRITTDFSKTEMTPIISMPVAVEIYCKLLKWQKGLGFGRPDDFVFQPKYTNRHFALRVLREELKAVCRSAGLIKAASGGVRTLYSLRHTAIMFRLLNGDKVDLVTLARNARTSVDMIDRFYARHLTAEMNVCQLQSLR